MIKIILTHIPNMTPSGFQDFIVTDSRPFEDGEFVISLETESPVKLKGENTYRQRRVQTITYPKYTLQLPDAQAEHLEMLKHGEKCYIVEDDALTKEIVVTDVNRTIQNKIWVVVLEYYVISENDYTDQVAEYLKSEYLISSGNSRVWKLFYDSENYIATKLDHIPLIEDAERQTTIQNDIEVVNKSVKKTGDTFTFYCSRSEVKALDNLHQYIPSVENYGTSKEMIDPRISPLEGWDIWKVEIDMITDIKVYKL